MHRVLIWDAPVRLMHWLTAGGILAALAIGLLADDDSAIFPVHMLIGLSVAAVLACRLVWGIAGTRYARFAGWTASPIALARYLAAMARGQPERHVGHNPASAYAILAMVLLTAGLVVTGILMGRGLEAAEEVHETLAYLLLATVAVHLLGVLLHTVLHRENITRGMIDGRKAAVPEAAIDGARPLAAVVVLAVVAAWTVGVVRGADLPRRTARLPLLGWTLPLGEAEDGVGGASGERSIGEGDGDDDD